MEQNIHQQLLRNDAVMQEELPTHTTNDACDRRDPQSPIPMVVENHSQLAMAVSLPAT